MIQIRSLVVLTFSAALFVCASSAFAGRVEKVKGNQVLISNEETPIEEGRKYFVVIDGKRRGVVEITKVRGGKSLGRITKGRAEPDASIEPAQARAKRSGEEEASSEEQPRQRRRNQQKDSSETDSQSSQIVGFLAGVATNSQDVTETSGRVAATTGMGYSLKAYADRPISQSMGLLGRAGVEQLSLSGSASTGSVTTSILYLTVDLLLRYRFSEGSFAPFAAAGAGIHYPLTKSSKILDENKISATAVIFAGLGFHYQMGSDSFLTSIVEYGLFPPSSTVKTSLIALRAGMGWRF